MVRGNKVELCIVIVARQCYNYFITEVVIMNKTISMSIRVSEDELEKLKQAARLEAYASYSEFIRRTALKEAERVIKNNKNQDGEYCEK